jgi:hypothetical protein
MGILTIDAIKQQSVSCCHEDECKTGGGNSCLPLVVHAGRQFGTPIARGKDCHSNDGKTNYQIRINLQILIQCKVGHMQNKIFRKY